MGFLDIFSPGRKATSKSDQELMYEKQNGKCMYCGNKLTLHYLHVDHKTPISKGGRDIPSNKQLVCQPCNNRKSNKTDGEFRRRYPRLKPASQAKGRPPRTLILQDYFVNCDKKLNTEKKKKTAKKKKGLFDL